MTSYFAYAGFVILGFVLLFTTLRVFSTRRRRQQLSSLPVLPTRTWTPADTQAMYATHPGMGGRDRGAAYGVTRVDGTQGTTADQELPAYGTYTAPAFPPTTYSGTVSHTQPSAHDSFPAATEYAVPGGAPPPEYREPPKYA